MGVNLILISCCDHKETGGISEYSKKDSILNLLSAKTRANIFRMREKIFSKVVDGKTIDLLRRQGIRKDNAYNKYLGLGPDISLENYLQYKDGQPTNTFYLPAYKRYSYGRFFNSAGQESFEQAIDQDCHTLLVSGLYGLITLREPIQLYSSYLADDIIPERNGEDSELLSKQVITKVLDLWHETDTNYINDSLLEYIDNHNQLAKDHQVEKVIDLLSESFYQNIFKWENLHQGLKQRKIQSLHRTVSGTREPEFLPDLGIYFKKLVIGTQCSSPKVNDEIKSNEFSRIKTLTFKEYAEPDGYIEGKLIDGLTRNTWDKLERETKNELIQAETLFDLSYSHSLRKMNEPADRNMHYWTAVECELHKIYGKIRQKRNERFVHEFGNIGHYIHHFTKGDLQSKCDMQILKNLKTINEIRPTAGHYLQNKRFISWGELDRARKSIISRNGLLRDLSNIK